MVNEWKWFVFVERSHSKETVWDVFRSEEAAMEAAATLKQHLIATGERSQVYWGEVRGCENVRPAR